MYVADYLRSFADCEIAGLLVRDREGPATDDDVARYQPVLNVAQHYRWQVVLDGCSQGYQAGPAQGVSFCIAEGARADACPKISLEAWQDGAADEPAFLYLTVPGDAVPESVLDWLEAARSGTNSSAA